MDVRGNFPHVPLVWAFTWPFSECAFDDVCICICRKSWHGVSAPECRYKKKRKKNKTVVGPEARTS